MAKGKDEKPAMTLRVLRRLTAMDYALATIDGLDVAKFAEARGVSTRMVRRDLEAFRALGKRMYRGVAIEGGRGQTRWRYYGDVLPLFSFNLKVPSGPGKGYRLLGDGPLPQWTPRTPRSSARSSDGTAPEGPG